MTSGQTLRPLLVEAVFVQRGMHAPYIEFRGRDVVATTTRPSGAKVSALGRNQDEAISRLVDLVLR